MRFSSLFFRTSSDSEERRRRSMYLIDVAPSHNQPCRGCMFVHRHAPGVSRFPFSMQNTTSSKLTPRVRLSRRAFVPDATFHHVVWLTVCIMSTHRRFFSIIRPLKPDSSQRIETTARLLRSIRPDNSGRLGEKRFYSHLGEHSCPFTPLPQALAWGSKSAHQLFGL